MQISRTVVSGLAEAWQGFLDSTRAELKTCHSLNLGAVRLCGKPARVWLSLRLCSRPCMPALSSLQRGPSCWRACLPQDRQGSRSTASVGPDEPAALGTTLPARRPVWGTSSRKSRRERVPGRNPWQRASSSEKLTTAVSWACWRGKGSQLWVRLGLTAPHLCDCGPCTQPLCASFLVSTCRLYGGLRS